MAPLGGDLVPPAINDVAPWRRQSHHRRPPALQGVLCVGRGVAEAVQGHAAVDDVSRAAAAWIEAVSGVQVL